jgi:hypothetical protein
MFLRRKLFCLLLAGGLFACDDGSEATTESYSLELLKQIEWIPDSLLRPLSQEFSTLRFPLNEYGPHYLFNPTEKQEFSFGLGHNDGEYLRLNFDSARVSFIVVHPPQNPYLEPPTQLECYMNGSYMGDFPVPCTLNVPKILNHITLVFRTSAGMNKAMLPLNNDTGKVQTVVRTIQKIYNSRPLGIGKIEFLDNESNVIPTELLPYANGNIEINGNADPNDKYFLQDNQPMNGLRLDPYGAEARLSFQSETWRPFLRMRWRQSIRSGDFTVFNAVLPNGHRMLDTLESPNPQIHLQDSLVSKGFGCGFWCGNRDQKRVSPGLSHFQFFTGKRWALWISDSLDAFSNKRQDSLLKTPLAPLVNQSFTYHTRKHVYVQDLLIENADDTLYLNPQETADQTLHFCLRSRGNFSLTFTRSTQGKQLRIFYFGRWYYHPDQPHLLGLSGYSRTFMFGNGKSKRKAAPLVLNVSIEAHSLLFPEPFALKMPLHY